MLCQIATMEKVHINIRDKTGDIRFSILSVSTYTPSTHYYKLQMLPICTCFWCLILWWKLWLYVHVAVSAFVRVSSFNNSNIAERIDFLWTATSIYQYTPVLVEISQHSREPKHKELYLSSVHLHRNALNVYLKFFLAYLQNETRHILCPVLCSIRAWGSVVVKALRYYSDGPGIDFRWCHWGDFFRGSSDRTMCPEVDSASESEYQGFLLG